MLQGDHLESWTQMKDPARDSGHEFSSAGQARPRSPVPEAGLPWFSQPLGVVALPPTGGSGGAQPPLPLRLSRNPGCSHHRLEDEAGTPPFFSACRGQGSPASSLQKKGGWDTRGPGKRAAFVLTTLGLKGGWISRFSSFSQSILRKKACSRTSRSPSGPQPSRLPGCLVISWKAGGERGSQVQTVGHALTLRLRGTEICRGENSSVLTPPPPPKG